MGVHSRSASLLRMLAVALGVVLLASGARASGRALQVRGSTCGFGRVELALRFPPAEAHISFASLRRGTFWRPRPRRQLRPLRLRLRLALKWLLARALAFIASPPHSTLGKCSRLPCRPARKAWSRWRASS